ncbi:outer membrane protein transport protein [Hoeflea sp. G2-23]|uniref:Outer membrane protein transport protein n=1 Tax=Hoeflea algicola TaxID=2983763 RepID=A0ABT3Z604_9HYPH|nr:outer membrane protein transport protein [Hoeflea algicola]MCY0147093.1 outer membrane protein transport protein [Hoeflea algicola]
MITGNLKTLVAVLAASAAMVSVAQAGGFNRGSANLDGLFSDSLGIYSGVTYVAPGRSYSSVTGLRVVGGAPAALAQGAVEFGDSFAVPYASAGGEIFANTACVGSYSQPYGADSSYSGDITYHIASQSLATRELGLTCSYRYELGKGRISFIGGVFNEYIEYDQARNFNLAFGTVGDSKINVSSDAWGYRLGLAYEIPEIALKASLMYRSQTDHTATGMYTNTPFATLAVAGGALTPVQAAAVYGANMSTTATTNASLPQSVELAVQSGVAPGWLAFGSIKWTEWSVLQSITLTEGIAGTPFSTSRFFFKDGWTVTGGVAHRFNEQLAASASLTWDRGVTTGWDTLTDTWTLAGGVAYDVNEKIQIRAGGAAIHFASGNKSKTASAVDYTAVSPSEWGYALSASASVKF